MSHHLVSDRQYLTQLATSRIPYVGLLGPIDRRRRLLNELGPLADQIEYRLHGPAGLDIGGRGPAAIALSIVAEMHQELMRKDVTAYVLSISPGRNTVMIRSASLSRSSGSRRSVPEVLFNSSASAMSPPDDARTIL